MHPLLIGSGARKLSAVEFLLIDTVHHMATTASSPIPLKIVVVGDGGVGKSSCTLRFINREFSDTYDPTIEDSYTTKVTVDGQEYSIELLDTAGQEDYHANFGEAALKDGDGFILTYSVDRPDSFDLLPRFMHHIRKVKTHEEEEPTTDCTPENTPYCFMILGNKADTQRVVTAQTGLTFARSSGGLFCECSAKTRANIDTAFTTIVRATARSKRARDEYVRKRGTLEGFNGNVAMLDRGPTFATSGEKPSRGNPNLSFDRKMDRTRSMGGLAEPEQKGCGCLVS